MSVVRRWSTGSLGAPASRRFVLPTRSQRPSLAGGTPALPFQRSSCRAAGFGLPAESRDDASRITAPVDLLPRAVKAPADTHLNGQKWGLDKSEHSSENLGKAGQPSRRTPTDWCYLPNSAVLFVFRGVEKRENRPNVPAEVCLVPIFSRKDEGGQAHSKPWRELVCVL